MRRFAALFRTLDGTTSTNAKVSAMAAYFRDADPRDGAWAVYSLSGRRLKRHVGGASIRRYLVEASGLPPWLVEESHQHVGDLAETVALVLDSPVETAQETPSLHEWMEQRILRLRDLDDEQRRETITGWWRTLQGDERFLVTKLLTGSLRVGVSQTLVERALAEATGRPRALIAHRLMGDWTPDAAFYRGLFEPGSRREDDARPYPFFLAHALAKPPTTEVLGPVSDWQVEWKWDGMRGQLVRRAGRTHLWSRGVELISHAHPEIVEPAAALPDGTVLDGEILAWGADGVMPFAQLQRRLGRKRLGEGLRRAVPTTLLAYDILEHQGEDVRGWPLRQRRQLLETMLHESVEGLRLSPLIEAAGWSELAGLQARARERRVEGLMVKHRDSPYGSGRRKGPWWKWKVAPLTVDAVLLYAHPGHGRRANLYTDYTFAVWHGDDLVPLAKAYSGLDDAEIRTLDHWIRRHTRERFGPVRAVSPEQVFELAFEGINPSRRHKSGVALRFPRIARWRQDLGPGDADSLERVKALLDHDAH